MPQPVSVPDLMRAMAITSGDWREAARAQAMTARDIARAREQYAPEQPPPRPKCLKGSAGPEDVVAVLAGDDDAQQEFADFRTAVFRVESQNAGRLKTLLWAIGVLRGLGGNEAQAAEALERWVRWQYNVHDEELQTDRFGRRKQAVKRTRQYTALPRSWRGL